MVQLPLVLVEAGLRIEDRVIGDRLPALVVESPAAEHLVVLGLVTAGRIGVSEAIGEADALDRPLGDAVELARRPDAGHREHRRDDVDRVHVLAAILALRFDAVRPVDDERVGHAALVHLTLPAAERRVAGDRPAPRVVVMGEGPAYLVEASEPLFDRRAGDVPRTQVVERALDTTLRAGAVIGEHEDERVVEFAELA